MSIRTILTFILAAALTGCSTNTNPEAPVESTPSSELVELVTPAPMESVEEIADSTPAEPEVNPCQGKYLTGPYADRLTGDTSDLCGEVTGRCSGETRDTVTCHPYLTGDVTNISGDVTGLNGNVTNISGDVSNIDGWAGDLSGDVSDLSGRIGRYLSGNVEQLEGEITDLNGNASNISGDVSNIDGWVGDISGDVSDLTGRVSQYLRGDVTHLSGSISGKTGVATTLN